MINKITTRDDKKAIINQVIDAIVAGCSGCHSIYLFGSWATEHETESSDLDIAVLLPGKENPLQANTMISLANQLAQIASVESVDLIDIRHVDTIFQIQIINTGQRFDIDDGNEADLFEMTTLSQYQKLYEERKEILREGIERGRFYHV